MQQALKSPARKAGTRIIAAELSSSTSPPRMLRRPRLTCISLGKPRLRLELRSKAGQVGEIACS